MQAVADITRKPLEVATMRDALPKVAVVGLGYVGLQVAVEFGRRRPTVGYDVSRRKVARLQHHIDSNGELGIDELRQARHLTVTEDPAGIASAEYVIVAVPTPVDEARQPDLGPLQAASRTVGQYLKPGATVVYESTVYPGATEEVCVPLLERHSGLRWRHDFHVGYSPERINPGDREHGFARITKVVAGDDAQTLEKLAALYGSVVRAGVYRAPSIRVAEAAKVIENIQRDLNIALVNELAMIFDRIGLDTMDVLKAASTKWNFLSFRPGLAGGHCIGADPWHLSHRAEMAGYHPQVILAGRRINDGMGAHVACRTVQEMIAARRNVTGSRVNVLGLAFKENCADIRSSRVIDVIRELQRFGVQTCVHDPHADFAEALQEYGVRLHAWDELPAADALILAVPHREFVAMPPAAYLGKIAPGGCFIDVKSVFDPETFRREGLRVWRL